jgi:hypothetical protein
LIGCEIVVLGLPSTTIWITPSPFISQWYWKDNPNPDPTIVEPRYQLLKPTLGFDEIELINQLNFPEGDSGSSNDPQLPSNNLGRFGCWEPGLLGTAVRMKLIFASSFKLDSDSG